MEERSIRQRLKQYLLGNAGEKEINLVDNWYQSFDNEPVVLSEVETAATKQEIWDNIAPAVKIERKIGRLSPAMKVAAMIIIIAGAAGAFLLQHKNKDSHPDVLAYTTISTGIGEKKKITIQDGSRLILDAGTTIRIQNDFSKDRKIELIDGEAFFDVSRDDQRPFIIQTGGLITTVLGTSFNISAYKELNNVSIGVVSGKVSVVNKSATLSILEKDQELVYNKNNKTFKTIPLDESSTAWQEGRLVLNDLSFDEMAAIIKKNFGIDMVTNEGAIKRTRYTTELLSAMSPAEAVEVLAAIHNLSIQQKGKKFFLYK